jgi:putative flippase GtrA
VWLAVNFLNVAQWLAPVLAIVAIVPLNFVLTRAFIRAGIKAGNASSGQ